MAFEKPVCNCPDATQAELANVFSNTSSRLENRNWVSRTGSNSVVYPFPGIKTTGGYCKHELAVLIIRQNLSDAFPNGIPYQPRIVSPSI
jgi:hypothetical protein